MLVLSRRRNESILIDGRIRVTVMTIQGNHVRLGIEAPADVSIWRSELLPPAPQRVTLDALATPESLVGAECPAGQPL